MSLTAAPGTHRTRLLLLYLAGVTAALVIFIAISRVGERALGSVAGSSAASRPPAPFDVMLHVLLALAVMMIAGRLVGGLFGYLRQPPVIGEVFAGIMLGPSLLGGVFPSAYAFLLPAEVAPYLGIIAQLGIVLYMFVVGLHLDLRVLRTSAHATLAISHASIIVPFLLGAVLALALYSSTAGEGVRFTTFALFLGVSMSVTAFPVLARILEDKELQTTPLGMLALTCAAVDDVTAWCLLAFVVSVSQTSLAGAFLTVGLTVVYIAVMFVVVQPFIRLAVSWLEKFERLDQARLAAIFIGVLLSALATEFIGIHAIFGAFLFGAVIPHASRVAADVSARLEDLVRVMFLPAFFALTGMRTEIGLLVTWQDWAICGAIVAVAVLGKFGGTFVAARLAGLGRSDSATLGVLMNTRGLVELIVLNIGLDIGAITPRLFTMLVIMALVTTFMTGPMVEVFARTSYRRGRR